MSILLMNIFILILCTLIVSLCIVIANQITKVSIMDLSKSLKVAIATKGVKHKDLAEQIGTTGQQISNWIRTGTIKQSSLVKVSFALGFSVSEFVALGE